MSEAPAPRKIAGNEVLEIWGARAANGAPTAFHADKQVQDQRAKLVFTLIQVMASAIGNEDKATQMMNYAAPTAGMPQFAAKPFRPAHEVVNYAVEIVDHAWTELELRGWILDMPSYRDYVE